MTESAIQFLTERLDRQEDLLGKLNVSVVRLTTEVQTLGRTSAPGIATPCVLNTQKIEDLEDRQKDSDFQWKNEIVALRKEIKTLRTWALWGLLILCSGSAMSTPIVRELPSKLFHFLGVIVGIL